MDGCVRLGPVLTPLFIRQDSDADCDRSRCAGQWGQRAAAAKGRILRKSEGGGERQAAGEVRLPPGSFALRPSPFSENPITSQLIPFPFPLPRPILPINI